MSNVIVGIGCDRAQELAAEVLVYSVECHAHSMPKMVKLYQVAGWHELATAFKHRQRTPFSYQRFLLAQQLLDSAAEVGIYVDSDMLVLRPIEQLVEKFHSLETDVAIVQPLKEWRRRQQSSVLVMNRSGAEALWSSYTKHLEGQLDYDDLIYLRTIREVGSIDYTWNCLEYLDENSALIHYTDMDTQPWLRDGNPNAGIWYTYLWRLAQRPEGRALIAREISKGYVRPALLEVVDSGPSISAFSARSRLRDSLFVPPHRFRRLSSPALRTLAAPLLRTLIELQFAATNGQLNVR